MENSKMNQVLAVGLALAICGINPAAAMSKAACRAAIEYSDAHRGVSVLVLKNGEIVCAPKSGAGSPKSYELWSGTKSFVGVMAAAAVEDGLLTLDEPASKTITEWADDKRKAAITIRQLLSMTSGLSGKVGKPPTYEKSIAAPMIADPGARFIYSPTSLQVFGEILRRKLLAAGGDGDPVAYFKRRVLDPAGVSVTEWRRGPDNNPLMPQGAIVTAQQWARFGEFIRLGGRANGQSLVDPAAFAELFHGSNANPAYGLTWWLANETDADDPVTVLSDIPANAENLPDDLVFAAGAGEQRLFILPSQGLTIVRLAKLDLIAALAGKRSGWSDRQFLQMVIDNESE
jgi:CubicO group peptidase (beta-lactamase class C family)